MSQAENWRFGRVLLIAVVLLPALAGASVLATLQWEAYLKKSAQSEAKTNLSGLFTAEKAFFGEYMTYTTDLVSLNWFPDGEPLYVYGYCNAYPGSGGIPGISEFDGTRSDTSKDSVAIGDGRWNRPVGARYSRSQTELVGPPCEVLSAMGLSSAFKATGQVFTAFAIGNIDDDPDLDVWSIDQYKSLNLIARD